MFHLAHIQVVDAAGETPTYGGSNILFPQKQKSGTRLTVCALVVGAGHRRRIGIVWLALATITLAAAIRPRFGNSV
jgi:hypothetical protein